jgi:DNA repair exonuclease SbcCD ATPase subunit
MQFLSLSIQNFLALGKCPDLNLADRGLVLVQGENSDDPSTISNGAGKSSIGDALCWVLFGETARGLSGDAVVNEVAGKDCIVELAIKDGEATYQITRTRKHRLLKNSLKLSMLGASMVDLSKGTIAETQKEIERLIGCDHAVFTAAIYAGQEQMPDLPGMTDKQLKVLIEQAAGIERIEQAYINARNHAKDMENAAILAGRERADTVKRYEDSCARVETLAADIARWNDERKLLLDTLKREIAGMGAELVQIQEKKPPHDVESLQAKSAAVCRKSADITGMEKAAEQFWTKECMTGHTQVARLQSERDTDKRAVDECKFKIANAETEILKPCKACGHVSATADDVAGFVKHQEAHLKVLEAKLAASQKKLETAEAAQAEKLALHKGMVGNIPDATALVDALSMINERIREVEAHNSLVEKQKSDLKQKMLQARERESEANPFEKYLTEESEKRDKLTLESAAKEEALQRAAVAVKLAKAAVEVFGPAGVRAHILDTVTPFLNERTSVYLSTLSDGNITAVWTTLSFTAKGELKEQFKIDVRNACGAKNYAGLSGGEKRKVRVSTMLALQDLVASRATKPIDFYLADEIDDALDEAGLERLMTILFEKAKEKGTVLLISHNSLRDWCDEVTTVRKEKGVSTIEGALVATSH